MPDDQTPNLKLPYIMAAQAQKHVTHNEAIRALDAIVQLAVLSKGLAQPSGSPVNGQRYIVAASASGIWAGQSGQIAAFQDGAWIFLAPKAGWVAWVGDEAKLYAFVGTTWTVASGGLTDPASKLGINATADTTNRLVVASPASLFNHDGSGHQQKINKAASGATASQLYQVAYSGRAEIGLTGDDDFHFKVSANGTAWTDALLLKAATGTPRVPTFQVTQLPSAALAGAGAIVNVSDEAGGAVIAFSDGQTWRRVTDRAVVAAAALTQIPLFILAGESNAGGLAVNSDATSVELAARPSVQIFNVATSQFQDLRIGVNNLIGHASLAENATHGLELGLANAVEAGRFAQAQIYKIKTGQGGSRIAQWATGDASGYWATALARFNAAKSQLATAAKAANPTIIWSQGINDANAGTAVAIWKAATIAHFAKLRAEWGASTPILMTTFTNPPLTTGASLFAAYNAAMAEIAAADPLCFVIDTSGTTAVDAAHWDYRGLLIIAERIADLINGATGPLASPTVTPAAGSYAFAQTVSLSGPSGAAIRYTTSGETPTSHSPVYTAALTVAATQTIKAVAFRQGYRMSSVASAAYTINATPLATPVFTPAAGTYASAQSVGISGPSGATIRYTTDGATPTSTSPIYTAPLTVSATQTIKAIAQQAGFTDSAIASATFTIAAAASYVTWTAMTGAQQTGDYLVPTVTGGTTVANGGRATQTIDATQPFSVIVDMSVTAEVEQQVVYITDVLSTANEYTWGNGIGWAAGLFSYASNLYSALSNTNFTQQGTGTPPLVRMTKSGNDVLLQKSTDGGGTWVLVTTFSGALAGKSTMYVKATNAGPIPSKRVRVKIA